MNGILNVLKPPSMTSFDIVGFLRRLLKIKKIGHTGTLDPGAVGVLPVCIGNATKAIEFMMEKDKLYRAELTLGIETDTQDSSGVVIRTSDVSVTDEEIISAVNSFRGKIKQVPPMYSALKVDGRKLYDLAREGITIERKPREIEIHSINVLNISRCPVNRAETEDAIDIAGLHTRVLFDVSCSKGTYIRTLCADIGSSLGCGGHMSFLLRMRAGSFDISSALTVEEIRDLAEKGRLYEKLSSVDAVFEHLNKLVLDEVNEKKFLNGMFIKIGNRKCEAALENSGTDFKAREDKNAIEGDILRVYNTSGVFIALGEYVPYQGELLFKSKKLFL